MTIGVHDFDPILAGALRKWTFSAGGERARKAGWILIGLVFVWAGSAKAADPLGAVKLVGALLGIDPHIARALVQGVAVAEVATGVTLIGGWVPRLSTAVATLALLCFSCLLAFGVFTKYRGACGCLGLHESVPSALLRNGIMFLVASVSFWFGSGRPR